MKNSSENKSEKILISLALFMFAAMIGYNLFFTPKMPEIIQNTGDIVNADKQEEKNEEENQNRSELLNINTASEEELTENLNGVGPAIAKRIIKYRETHGGFSKVEEIMNVKGIGEKIFERIKNDITTTP